MSKSTNRKGSQILSKINFIEILTDHLDTLKDYGSSSYSIIDIFLFFIFPLLLSIIIVYFGVLLNKDLIGILINVFAIFAGLLFNLLVLVYDVISKVVKPTNTQQANRLKLDSLKQIYSNISFEILLSLFVVLLLAISFLFNNKIFNLVLSILVFSLVFLFSLTLFMILKRIHKLLSYEIDQQKDSI